MELLDDEEKPLPGYSLEDCFPVTADGTDLAVQWKDHSDLSGARGKTVRLRFRLENARLYSYRGGATDYRRSQTVEKSSRTDSSQAHGWQSEPTDEYA